MKWTSRFSLSCAALALWCGLVPLALQAQTTQPARIEWFREARFGLFIHWGPVSLKGTEIGWSRGGPRRGMAHPGTLVPVELYDNLYRKFNPTRFNAREWVALAKAAGMKYLVFTTKHHDGFSMFDTALSEYKITRSPFGRDVVGELAAACHEGGLRLGFYYSPVDWYHADYRTDRHARYVEFMHGQIRELCTGYGKVDIVWFDGLGGKPEDWDSHRLLADIRARQSGAIINNRAGLPADYDTPEQVVGRFQIDRPWETCMTLGDRWAYKPNDAIKPLDECIRILARTVGGDGNLLLNVGPTPTGEIEAPCAQRLREIGRWLAENGESVYGTRGGPFRPAPWGVSTYKGDTVYLHVLAWEGDDLTLPPIERKVLRASVLNGDAVRVRQDSRGIHVSVPPAARQSIDTVIALSLDGSAADVKPPMYVSGSLAKGKSALASNFHWKDETCGPAKALDDDFSTAWITDTGVVQAWMEVDLGSAAMIGRAVVCEASARTREFQIEYRDGDTWRTLHVGKTIGPRRAIAFPPVKARVFRLNIRSASRGPEICEFQLFGPATDSAPERSMEHPR